MTGPWNTGGKSAYVYAVEPTKMSDRFDRDIDRVLLTEGGYTDDRDDPGNWTGGAVGRGLLKGTKYGISAASYPHLNIRELTLQQAKDIYREDFWEPIQGDTLNPTFSYQLLDATVNHGSGNSIRWLQRAVGVADDGRIGPVTLAAVRDAAAADIVLLFNAERLDFYRKLKNWPKYGRGWAGRIVEALRYAAKDN